MKYQAALGLAYAGDPVVASLVFSQQAAQVLSPGDRLVAACALGASGEEQLIAFLDDADEKLRNWALLLLMLWQLRDIRGTAAYCLACLSSRMPRVRLTAARGLPFRLPNPFPQNSLHAARLALIGHAEGWGTAFTRAVYEAEFARGGDIDRCVYRARRGNELEIGKALNDVAG